MPAGAGSEERVEKRTSDLLRKMRSVLSTPPLMEHQRTPTSFHKESCHDLTLDCGDNGQDSPGPGCKPGGLQGHGDLRLGQHFPAT